MMKSVLLCFFQRIKERQGKKDIKKIKDVDSGHGYTKNTNIMIVFEIVYQKFCVTWMHLLKKIVDSQLKKISGMKNNKTLGMDGLTAEFYKTFFGRST